MREPKYLIISFALIAIALFLSGTYLLTREDEIEEEEVVIIVNEGNFDEV